MNDNYPVRGEEAVALPSQPAEYGMITSYDMPVLAEVSDGTAISPADKLRFLTGEVSGLLFLIMSTLYIFVMPISLTKQGMFRVMIQKAIKRSIDIFGAIVGLILSAPLWVILPILIKLDSPGKVFYSQVRIGANRRKNDRRFCQSAEAGDSRKRDRRREDYLGRPFKMYKFRTMVSNAESKSGPVWAKKNDSRITRLGNILRMTRMDEVPQFLNILKGEMSLVGPRPERPMFVKDLSTRVENYSNRLTFKPGLTGLAQVENGYDYSVDTVVRKVTYDLKYIREWSLWSDFKILCRTFIVVITGRGAC